MPALTPSQPPGDGPPNNGAVDGMAGAVVDEHMGGQRSVAFARVLRLCRMYAPLRRPVVLVGPIGVGKSTLARLLHRLSGRVGQLVAVSAGEIPDSLAQSVLFGHMRGSFTGAHERKRGAFEQAAGGTLLLDDVGQLSTLVQATLLRALEDRSFTPLGAARDIPVTCRELYATTQDPDVLARQGVLIDDFRSRMDEFVVVIPPLRDRPEDILPLAEGFVASAAKDLAWKVPTMSSAVQDVLLSYPWPYNVRELRGVIERAVVHAHDERRYELTPDHLPDRLLIERFSTPLRRLTRELVRTAIRESAGNRSEAARRLGVHRNSLYRYL